MHYTKDYKNTSINNLNDLENKTIAKKHQMSDYLVQMIGSWRFIVVQSIILVIWSALNITAYLEHWDPYPFILLNLLLSLQSAYAAPIIMMSQNRQAARDRLEAHNDYLINKKAEKEVGILMERLEAQNKMLNEMHNLLLALKNNQMAKIL